MYNKVFLIGNLTRDPEMRYTTSGIPVTRFTLAVNRGFKTDNQDVDFIKVLTWRKLAEFCGEYLNKGKSVSIEGHLQINEYEKDGKKRYFSEVHADRLQILSRKNAGDEAEQVEHTDGDYKSNDGEDIPF
ncbi:MAG: hypothetical protein A2Y40_03875 [Candidatus Margulisbacteria bacterium GWF2_35_9]|nr:MAG: hypothetical protein A2Y40_03875 [Candidatus Margulisbacteria bacterium GWF2_35_9]